MHALILFCEIQNESKRWNCWTFGFFLYGRFKNWDCLPVTVYISPFIIKCQIHLKGKKKDLRLYDDQNIAFLTLSNMNVVLNSLKWISFRHFTNWEIHLLIGLFGQWWDIKEWMREQFSFAPVRIQPHSL